MQNAHREMYNTDNSFFSIHYWVLNSWNQSNLGLQEMKKVRFTFKRGQPKPFRKECLLTYPSLVW